MIKRLRHFFFHNWEIWGVLYADAGAYQQRRCAHCGLQDRRGLECGHIWGAWNAFADVTQETRQVGFVQIRRCTLCNFAEVNTQTIFGGMARKPGE